MHYFNRINLRGWRQFTLVDIDLSRQTTILTGQNGSGKTTILNILSHHFGWNVPFISTPFWGKRRAQQFWSDVRKSRESDLSDEENEEVTVGSIEYDNGTSCALRTQSMVAAQYHLKYRAQQPVVGIHIPSHRPPAVYHKIERIPTKPEEAQKYYQDFHQLLVQTYGSSNRVQ